ncbi:MAG: DotU family type IV/VI secretion system protein [Gemmataceae bacterium]|nr:DotU family type IV/VI secretion system protein [Gemmataceae bacterium]
MRKEIADVVYPVFSYALRVKAQLARGEPLSWEKEQSVLKGMLHSPDAARRWGTEYGGDQNQSLARPFGGDPGMSVGRATDSFLGIRYALVCWLDEIFILDSPWRAQWTENSLELALYSTRIRAEKFWDQARRAESRPETDALEVYFLCVMLGFRGDLRDQPDQLRARREAWESQIAQNQMREPALPPDGQPLIDVPPLHGSSRFRTALVSLATAILLLIPAGVFYLVSRLQR